MAPKNLLLFGATGTIGTYILEGILSARSQFDRVAIFTSPNTAETKKAHLENLKKQGVEIIIGNIEDEESIKAAYKGIDTVISSLGRSTILHQIPLIRLAASTPSITLFLPSEFGTNIAHDASSRFERPHQQKLAVRAVLENEISREDLAYAYVVTGPFAEFVVQLSPGWDVLGGWDVKRRKGVLLGEGSEKISLTSMRDVGKLTLGTLLHASPEVLNRALLVNSFTTSPAEIQAEFERQTGGQAWEDVSRTSLAALREEERKAWDGGLSVATVITLKRIWIEGGTLTEQRANGLVGNPRMDTLEEVVANEIKRSAAL